MTRPHPLIMLRPENRKKLWIAILRGIAYAILWNAFVCLILYAVFYGEGDDYSVPNPPHESTVARHQ